MTPHQSHLLPDGRVFPPVTPDPPAPPGQEEIIVPELVVEHVADAKEAASEETAPEQTPTESPG